MNNVQTVAEIFAGKLLQIPDYQRGYAWDEQNWDDFLDDLDLLEPGKDHFTGLLVLHDQNEQCQDVGGSNYQVFHVVDGQQRLTTIVLLLDMIRREVAKAGNKELEEGIRKGYISVLEFHSRQPLFKLRLNEDTHDFFVNNVLGDDSGPNGPTIRSQRRLLKAKRHFGRYLASQETELGEEYEGWLLKLYNKVTSQLKVSLYVVSDASEVGVIFEVMNDRGKDLSDLEKVKNYLLYVSSKLSIENHDLRKRINDTWSNIFRRLMASDLVETSNEDQLLRVHWIISYDYQSKTWKRSKSIKERFSLRSYKGRHEELLSDLVEYTTSLDRASVAFCDVAGPRRNDAFNSLNEESELREIVSATVKLGRMRAIATFLPLLVATRLRNPQNGSKYLEMARACEVFAFRVYRLLERRANTGESTLRRLAYQMYAEGRSFEDVIGDLRGTLLYYCPDREFEQAFELDEIENDWYRWTGLKYFLYEYELHLAEGQAVQMTWDDIEGKGLENTIEHILPQTPDRRLYWTSRFDKEARRVYTHDIANLCLTYHNSSYGNKPFPEKKEQDAPHKPSYANSNLFQERRLSYLEDWNIEELEKRREEIVEWALKRWHVDQAIPAPPDLEEVDEQDAEEPAPEATVS